MGEGVHLPRYVVLDLLMTLLRALLRLKCAHGHDALLRVNHIHVWLGLLGRISPMVLDTLGRHLDS